MGIEIQILIHGNGNWPVEMGVNGNNDCVPAHLYFLLLLKLNFFARCYGWCATSEYRFKIGYFAPTGAGWPKISGRRVNDLLYSVKSRQIFLPFCHNARVWQRQTDRRTSLSSLVRAGIPCSAEINHDCICKYGAVSVLSSGTIDDFEWPLKIIPTILICKMMQHVVFMKLSPVTLNHCSKSLAGNGKQREVLINMVEKQNVYISKVITGQFLWLSIVDKCTKTFCFITTCNTQLLLYSRPLSWWN